MSTGEKLTYERAGRREAPSPRPWWQDAIFYAVDVPTFRDANGDGVGDFPGLTASLDYLVWLGVDALWLLPFFPSQQRDNGYDITDHFGVDPALGTITDFVTFIREAEDHGIRVVLDLVVNHTSDQHPWFQAARRRPDSEAHGYYVWTNDPSHEIEQDLVFPGMQSSVWTYAPDAGAYYFHHFYEFEPDLNTAHPVVQAEIRNIIEFWLRMGVDGFRVDAAPFLGSDLRGDPATTHSFLRKMREWGEERNPEAVWIAEADMPAPDLDAYFGDGREMDMLFNFLLNQYLYLALADESAEPIRSALKIVPPAPPAGQWLNFARNLDELSLAHLELEERERVFAAFAPEPMMRIYGRGIRRRLTPMLGYDRRRLELFNSLLFSLPGTPVIVYGDEIGIGEDLLLPERFPVRTPMQWDSKQPNSGFSDADPRQLIRPIAKGKPDGAPAIGVADQRSDETSLLNWMRQLIVTRKAWSAIGLARPSTLDTGNPAVLALCWEGDAESVITVHNMSARPQEVTLPTPRDDPSGRFGARTELASKDGTMTCRMDAFGYQWIRFDT